MIIYYILERYISSNNNYAYNYNVYRHDLLYIINSHDIIYFSDAYFSSIWKFKFKIFKL